MKFCNWMQLEDPCMETQPPEARNYFLACYAVSLVQGHTIKGICVKHSTLKQYMKDAFSVFADRQVTHFSDPDYLAIVMKAHSNYESVPMVKSSLTLSKRFLLQPTKTFRTPSPHRDDA